MKLKLIYPRWPKLQYQTEFHLPPHGPMVFAATLPEEVQLSFVDENVEPLRTDDSPDLVALSTMLTCQLPRAFEIAREYRERGIPVLFGGIATMLHSEEVRQHADAVFLGETEGRMGQLLDDFEAGKLKSVYNLMGQPPAIESVGPARREILNRELYNYRGVQMLDLVHASRGCKFDCFPCCTGFLGGKQFRPRPVEKFIEELETIPNNRLFIVDNSLAQDREWLKELFTAMIPLKRKWVSHPILDDDEILDLAAEAGCWYVYQAVFDTSEVIRRRIARLRERGIGVEGTIILGTDDQGEDDIKRLVDFLMEVGLDVAEFTILTPFMQSPIRAQLEREGRILSNDWLRYTADQVVFQPKQMSPGRLQELYSYAWETFYAGSGHQLKMGELFKQVIQKEMADGTYRRYDPRQPRSFKRRGT
ncbi:radical SAM protein [Geothermobacter hydrogeniphilus]|uniref:Radical SAM protein n=1 Tax=Geothermobacter hydrogeniphilus TaxID=1969733 RepID=A0A2K2HBG8_9BACT|nr:cobalamin-dependent protein [Geothermobacter hydrogeniphilus]PNU20635.1 radical SAM protein [Geothermobacter hydrogeniphilus]